MTISRNNCGSDSRVVRALVEQVSQIQEDINVIDGRIDDLDRDKAETSDLSVSVNTQALTADNATIGGSTIINDNGLYSPNLDASYLHSQNADFNYAHSNVGYIQDLSTDALTVNGVTNTFDLNAKRVNVTETIDVPGLNADTVNANTLNVNGNVSALGITADSANYNVVNLQTLDVAQSLNVRDLNITGNISGLNNVDIVANSITTPTIEADEIKAGSIYTLETTDDYHLVPTPHLDNNDHYTIQLPSFTGTIVLKWVDDQSNEVWSATVIGDGKDYEIHWGTLGETLVVQKIYQYDGSLYIRHNANGSLYYSYHTTEKLGEIAVWYNYTALDTVVWEDYTHDCTTLSGTVSFGDFYVPKFVIRTSTFDDLLVRESLTVLGDSNLKQTNVTGLDVSTTETVIDPDTQEETEVKHEHFKADENGVTVKFESINWNGTDVKVCDDFDTTWVKD